MEKTVMEKLKRWRREWRVPMTTRGSAMNTRGIDERLTGVQ